MKQFFKHQFHYSKICLSHNDWRLFIYCPWLPRNSYQLIYLTYRWAVSLYFLAWLGYSGYQGDIRHGAKYLIFLSFWIFILLNLYLLLIAVACTYKYVYEIQLKKSTVLRLRPQDLSDPPCLHCCSCCERCSIEEDEDNDDHTVRPTSPLPWYMKVIWVLYTIISQTSVLIVIFYWVTGFDVINWDLTLHEHLFNGLPGLIDVMITAYPLRFYHFMYSSMFAAVYFIFTGIYFGAGGTHSNGDPFIYSILDYEGSPVTALIFIAAISTIIPVVFNSFFWLLYLMRTFLVYKKLGTNLPQSDSSGYGRSLSMGSTAEMIEANKSVTSDNNGNNVSSVAVNLKTTPL